MAAVGSVSVIGAIARRIAGPRAPRHVLVDKDGIRTAIGMSLGTGDTDPGRLDATRQLAADLDALREEVTGLRRELDEAQNRLDFTERLLGQAKERGLLNPPREP